MSLYMELLQLFLLIVRVIIFQKKGLVITVGSRRNGVMFCLLLHFREGVPYAEKPGCAQETVCPL